MRNVFGIFIITGLYLFSILRIFNLFVADVYFYSSKQLFEERKYSKALEHSLGALRLNPNEPAYYRQATRAYIGIGDLNFALSGLNKAQKLNENNLATLRNAAPLFYAIAKSNDVYKETAIAYYTTLKQKYPNDLGILVDVAEYEKKLGAVQNYEETVGMAKALRPDVLQWYPSFR